MSNNLVEIYCQDTESVLYVGVGSSLAEVLRVAMPAATSGDSKIVAAYCNGMIKDLTYKIYSSKSISFIALSSTEGMRVYARSLFFLLERAVLDVIPGSKLHIMHSVGRGVYAEIDGVDQVPEQAITDIKARMRELVDNDTPIVRRKMLYQQAMDMYRLGGYTDRIKLLETRPQYYVTIYNLAGLNGYFHGAMLPSTGSLDLFDVQPFGDGMVVLMPSRQDHRVLETMYLQPKLFDVFAQSKEWSRILDVDNVGSLNQKVLAGLGGDLIKVGEALQEKNFAKVADQLYRRVETTGTRLVLIAGPSSSGKTTFSKRLEIQLRVLGLKPLVISLDNYFVEREHTPRDENGEYDYESINALSIDDFNRDMNDLFEGKEVAMPKFNFQSGYRTYDDTKTRLQENNVLIVEGIHALNPVLTAHIAPHLKFKIYASALTTLSIDNMTVVHTTDNRILRRMVRDYNYRGRTAQHTLAFWASVRRGENQHIFPYQEQADMMFNTSLFFELSILKRHVEPLLLSVPANSPEYPEALRLLKFLNYFVDIPDTQLPPTSILREFLGGSGFEY